MVYNKEHKLILQTIMHEGFLSENKAKELIIKLFNDNKVVPVINQINEKLQLLNMLIKRIQCEITGQVYWVLISTVLDEITRFQIEFSKNQLALLRIIFSEIIISNNGCIQSTVCLNLCSSSDVKMSKADAEDFLEDMVNRKWLIYKDGYYYMGIRSITELMPYFKATYETNLNTCYLCKQILFHGKKCTNCETFFHLYCLKKFTMVCDPLKCPNCNTVISDVDLSGIQDDSTLAEENTSKVKKSSRNVLRNKN